MLDRFLRPSSELRVKSVGSIRERKGWKTGFRVLMGDGWLSSHHVLTGALTFASVSPLSVPKRNMDSRHVAHISATWRDPLQALLDDKFANGKQIAKFGVEGDIAFHLLEGNGSKIRGASETYSVYVPLSSFCYTQPQITFSSL